MKKLLAALTLSLALFSAPSAYACMSEEDLRELQVRSSVADFVGHDRSLWRVDTIASDDTHVVVRVGMDARYDGTMTAQTIRLVHDHGAWRVVAATTPVRVRMV
jgi:hypothetical protein